MRQIRDTFNASRTWVRLCHYGMLPLCLNVNTKLQAVLTPSFPVFNAENDLRNETIINALHMFCKTVGSGCETWPDDSSITHSAVSSKYI